MYASLDLRNEGSHRRGSLRLQCCNTAKAVSSAISVVMAD
jgi:hypothetical protein